MLRDVDTGASEMCAAQGIFILIGAEPFTDWLPPDVERDEWGYILTGTDAGGAERLAYESTMPGVFAIGEYAERPSKASRLQSERARLRPAHPRTPGKVRGRVRTPRSLSRGQPWR